MAKCSWNPHLLSHIKPRLPEHDRVAKALQPCTLVWSKIIQGWHFPFCDFSDVFAVNWWLLSIDVFFAWIILNPMIVPRFAAECCWSLLPCVNLILQWRLPPCVLYRSSVRDGRPVGHSCLLPLALNLRFKPLRVDWLKIMNDYESINVICETTPPGCMSTQISIEYQFFCLVTPFYSLIVWLSANVFCLLLIISIPFVCCTEPCLLIWFCRLYLRWHTLFF